MDDKQILTPTGLTTEPTSEVIPELPIEEARELYRIEFLIAPIGNPMQPLQDEFGVTYSYETHTEADEARGRLVGSYDYQVIEQRHLKTET